MFRRLRAFFRYLFGGEEEILCDTCKYDFGSACTRPERPNATRCPDYRRAGRG